MKPVFENYLITWLKRCLTALIFLTSSRILFILYLFPFLKGAPLTQLPMVLLSGVLFDIQAMVYFLSAFHLLSLLPLNTGKKSVQGALKWSFIIGLSAILLLNFIDMEFFKIKTRRSGIELFQLVSDPSNPVISYIYNYWWLSLLLIVSILLSVRLYPRQILPSPRPKPLYASITFVFFAALLFLGARGGFYTKPLRSFDAARFVDPRWVSAVINSPTQLLTSYGSAVPSRLEFMTDQDAFSIVQPVKTPVNSLKIKDKPNLVLIILESFGRDYCGFLNDGKRYTPFLDSLSRQSMVFKNAYSGGTTSMESLPAIFASIPSLLEVPYINSNFQNNEVSGAHHYLSRNGYDCSFYYGAANGSMGFDNFLKISGNISYYGRNEYPDKDRDFDGSWGIWDEPYLQYYAQQLSGKRTPFFSSVFTLTSHDPYKIPEKYQKVFKGGELPIHKSVEYTDHALRQFFKTASVQPWFANTIFIITADHPSHSKSEYFYTPTGKYEIPLLLYSPKYIRPETNDSLTVSHLDIMPTLLDLGQVKQPFFSMGLSLFNPANRVAVNRDYGIAQVIEYPYCLRLFPEGFKMHVQDKMTANEDIRYELTEEEKQRQKRLEKELMARFQLYTNSLLNNTYDVR
jgi:phosphoglycerol transferase MdoB-like AlkP superfamily enzyme